MPDLSIDRDGHLHASACKFPWARLQLISTLALIMFRSFAYALCIIPVAALAGQEKCVPYSPNAVVAGKLERRTYPGRPNYESIANGDEAETGFYVRLAHTMCTSGDPESPDAYPQKNVRRVQLVLAPSQYAELRPLLGQTVSLEGELFARHTGHHHAPLLLVVRGHAQSLR